MSFLSQFYSGSNECTAITAVQGSSFAKDIAGDFNPLHNIDSKRFCVPGDLLFAIVLDKYGLSESMQFSFTGMLGHGITLNFPEVDSDDFEINGSHTKSILKVKRRGQIKTDSVTITALIKDYVAFSGHNFPYVLVPLMEEQQVMINLTRPFVIYDSMSLEFDTLDFTQPTIEMLTPELIVNGKRAEAYLHFCIKSADKTVGIGFKKILISGLRAYEKIPMQAFVDNYLALKHAYLNK